jgi:low affinity Fe/Cu permease
MMLTVNLLNVIVGISVGLVMGKLTTFSLKNTLYVGVAALISLLSIFLMPYLPSLARF